MANYKFTLDELYEIQSDLGKVDECSEGVAAIGRDKLAELVRLAIRGKQL